MVIRSAHLAAHPDMFECILQRIFYALGDLPYRIFCDVGFNAGLRRNLGHSGAHSMLSLHVDGRWMRMKILVVGGGGREHALCWAIAASPLVENLYSAPGNAGINTVAECVPIGADDVDGLVEFAVERIIDFVIVGPEAPLVAGLVDRLEEIGIKAFGPSAAAAQLESGGAIPRIDYFLGVNRVNGMRDPGPGTWGEG